MPALVIDSSLRILHTAICDFDRDLPKYGTNKGVYVNELDAGIEVFAPVAMWVEAVDVCMQMLWRERCPFGRIRGIGGSGQQHGSVSV
jgi:xylulokinase